jgi:polyisoprenoid-binding protein YceI
MKRPFTAVFTALALGGLLPASALAGWELDLAHTHVSFQVGHLGLSHTPGIFRKVEGRLTFDDTKIEESTVAITIDAASIDTAHGVRDGHLRGPNWFDAERNPNITFVSTSVRRIDDRNYVIFGNLTIRGKTMPVEFNTALTNRAMSPFLKVPLIGFLATAKVKRSDFGMTLIPAVIADEVDLKIALELVRKP